MGFFSLVLGYLLGSIPSGWLAGRWLKGIDLRELGSGSTGATNVLRQVGKGPALVVFLIDVGKGAAAVLIARALGLGDWIQVLSRSNRPSWSYLACLAGLQGRQSRRDWIGAVSRLGLARGSGQFWRVPGRVQPESLRVAGERVGRDQPAAADGRRHE